MPTAERIKSKLNMAIRNVTSDLSDIVHSPGKDFTRERVFTLPKMTNIILGIGGQSLNKELYAYFNKYGLKDNKPAKKSAFVQQRAKIKPEYFYQLMQEFHKLTDDKDDLYMGYKLYAVDGSDIYVAHDEGVASYIKNGTNKGYNLQHLNAMFNLISCAYDDATIVPKPLCSERTELLTMLYRMSADTPRLIIADRGYASLNVFEHVNYPRL